VSREIGVRRRGGIGIIARLAQRLPDPAQDRVA
jgi:hypothetical protein